MIFVILKVKYEELEKIKNNSKKNAELLDQEIALWLNSIENLKRVWQGIDSENFCLSTERYLTKLRFVSTLFNNISEFIDKANQLYNYEDLKFKRKFESVRMIRK